MTWQRKFYLSFCSRLLEITILLIQNQQHYHCTQLSIMRTLQPYQIQAKQTQRKKTPKHSTL